MEKIKWGDSLSGLILNKHTTILAADGAQRDEQVMRVCPDALVCALPPADTDGCIMPIMH